MPLITAAPLVLSDQDREQLERMARSSSLPHRSVRQAKALIWAADGVPNEEIARRSRVDSDSVRGWRRRFEEKGVDGVGVIAKGRGRRSWLPAGTASRRFDPLVDALAGRPLGGGKGHRGPRMAQP